MRCPTYSLDGLGVGLLLRLLGEREELDDDDERARGPRFTGLGDLDTDLDTERRVGLTRGGGVGDLVVTGDFLGDFGGGDTFGDLGLGGAGGALSLTSLGSFVTSLISLVSFSFASFLALGALVLPSSLLLLLDPLLLRLEPLLLDPELLLLLLLDPVLELRLLLELPELDELLDERLRFRLPLSAPFFALDFP